MRDYETLKNNIKGYLENNRISKAGFCKECNISISSLNNILKGRMGNLSIVVLLKLSDYFECEMWELLTTKVLEGRYKINKN